MPGFTHPTISYLILILGKIQQVLLCGNATNRETLDYLRTISNDLQAVRGDFDEALLSSHTTSKVIVHGPLKIGLIHGHQVIPWVKKNKI